MSRRIVRSCTLTLVLALLAPLPRVLGQQTQVATRGPRFVAAGWSTGSGQEVTRAPVLRRRISLDLGRLTVDAALKEITRQARLEISYSSRVLDIDRSIVLNEPNISVGDALAVILAGMPVDVSLTESGQLALVKRTVSPLGVAVDSGAIAGLVTDARGHTPIVGATVSIERTRLSTTTDAAGRYRFNGLALGTYALHTRYIGYTPAVVTVTVRADETATADVVLERSAQELTQVVVTGTIVPTEVKAIPTPVSVISEAEIAAQRPQTVQEIFRKAVPGAVSWVNTDVPFSTQFSVRGASSLTPSTPSMKVFVDGIPVANGGEIQIDPASIARIEVIRGPQAAAIYGSEAIGGVIQIFTKRGDTSLSRPQVSAEAALGVMQTPYEGYRSVLKQEYKASMRGGGADIGFNVGVGYSRLADWLPPTGEVSHQSNPSVYGGMNFSRGIVSVDLSGRYYSQTTGNRLVNPELVQSGLALFSKPSYQPLRFQNQTIGVQLNVTPMGWWRSSVTAGIDHAADDIAQTQARLTTPDDTLLLVADRGETKMSIGFNSSIQGGLGRNISGSVTAGVDHWNYQLNDWYAFGALTTAGTIRVAPGGAVTATRAITKNTGFYAQAQIGFHDALFLTAGLRAEQNSEFGDSLGTPLSPRVGLSYVQPVGSASFKVRGSWGRAIRAPGTGAKLGWVTATTAQVANPELGPERQQGWDVGVDLSFGAAGSLGVTYYSQLATNLLDAVVLQTAPVYTQQFQNVGQVKNTGIEVEGALAMGTFTVQAQYGYTRARIEQLAPGYPGPLQLGDQMQVRPRHTAGASLTVTPVARTTMSAGVTYVGSWLSTDIVAQFRCFAGTEPCRPTLRDYFVSYPALTKINVSLVQQLTPVLAGFVAVDNLTNNQAFEITNLTPVTGRTSTLGLRLQF